MRENLEIRNYSVKWWWL